MGPPGLCVAMTDPRFTYSPPHPNRGTAAVPGGARWARALAWLPLLLLLLLACAGMVTGHQLAAVATAADNTDVTIASSVAPEIQLSADCTGAAVNMGVLVPGDPARETAADCNMTIGSTNHVEGVELSVADAGSPGAGAMRCVASCVAPVAPMPDGQGNPMPANSFGMRLSGTSGPAATSGVWNVNAAALPSGDYYDVQDTPDNACRTTGTGNGTCSFRFAAQASATQGPGDYEAIVRFEVQAR